MADPRRSLLDIYARVAAGVDPWDFAAQHAQRCGIQAVRLTEPATSTAERLAVHVAHAMHLHGPSLTLWTGQLERCGNEGPAQRLALRAARLFAGEEDMVLLAAALEGCDRPTADAGALVDGETCARIALAGLDPEDELQHANSGEALEVAGDLLSSPGDAAHAVAQPADPSYLVVGLRLRP